MTYSTSPKRQNAPLWTMEAIAQKAGVSIKTVSRVVNREPGVSEATRSRVARIIEEVGYHPHMGARSMRGAAHDCIGVTITAPIPLVPLQEDFFVRLFSSLYRIFGERGQYICFDLNPYHPDGTGDYARGLFEGRFAACILCGPLSPSDTTVRRIHRSGRPYLVFGRLDSMPECSSATVDIEAAMRISIAHLLARGHTRVGVLRGFHGYQPGEDRLRGYKKALEDAGIEPKDNLVQNVTFDAQVLSAAVHRLLINRSVTALVDASGAEDAASIREGCRRAGRTPGTDVEIVDWTYTDGAAPLRDACAHVWLPVWQAAVDGLEELARWFDGEREGPVQVLYPPTLRQNGPQIAVAPPHRLFDLAGNK